MINFIGMPLNEVTKQLDEQNKKYIVKNNNFNVAGDTVLVTNVKEQKQEIVLIVGEFIFDLKKEQNDKEEWNSTGPK